MYKRSAEGATGGARVSAGGARWHTVESQRSADSFTVQRSAPTGRLVITYEGIFLYSTRRCTTVVVVRVHTINNAINMYFRTFVRKYLRRYTYCIILPEVIKLRIV